MSDSSDATAVKNRVKKPSGNSRGVLPLGLGVAKRTIFVGFPPPAVVACPAPFHASGNNDPATVMDPTATIVTPTGNLTGNLLANPDPPFTFTYEFTDPLPQGVPLALVVRGTNAAGQVEEVVVPFQGK
jgi:hypothetical protein